MSNLNCANILLFSTFSTACSGQHHHAMASSSGLSAAKRLNALFFMIFILGLNRIMQTPISCGHLGGAPRDVCFQRVNSTLYMYTRRRRRSTVSFNDDLMTRIWLFWIVVNPQVLLCLPLRPPRSPRTSLRWWDREELLLSPPSRSTSSRT